MEDVKFEISLHHLAKVTGLTKNEIKFMYEYGNNKDKFVYALLSELHVEPSYVIVREWKKIVRLYKRIRSE